MSRASTRRALKASSLGQLMRLAAAGRHNLWDVFSDAVEMMALSIANAVDRRPEVWQQREDRYLARAKRYSAEELALFPQMLAALVEQLETHGPDDVLGKLFGELDLGNEARGQFFTPYEVCRLMAQVNLTPDTLKERVHAQGFVTLMEPACGAGAMVIAFAEAMQSHGLSYQSNLHVTCQDIDQRAVHMAYLQLSLLHVPAAIVLGNTLALECREVWYTPAHILGGWGRRLSQRHANPMLDLPANDNAPEPATAPTPEPEPELVEAVATEPEPPAASPAEPPRPLGEQLGLF